MSSNAARDQTGDGRSSELARRRCPSRCGGLAGRIGGERHKIRHSTWICVCESGPVEGPTIVFLHGGGLSGWAWQPVVDRMHQYSRRVADLPEHGKSFEQGPFEMTGAAAAVAELVRSCVRTGRAHVAGLHSGLSWECSCWPTSRALLIGRSCTGRTSMGSRVSD